MKILNIFLLFLLKCQLLFHFAQGQPSATVTTQPNESNITKGNFSCTYYNFDLILRFFNTSADVEEFIVKNTNFSCPWNRNNGNPQVAYHAISEFRRVDIRNSTIEKIPFKFFTNFTRVSNLRLRNAKIKEIKAEDFEGADVLLFLDLSGNAIRKLDNDQFVNLKSIKEIDLSNNQIDTIDDGAFNKMSCNLTRVDLSSNKIRTFREDFILMMISNVTRKWLPFDVSLRNNEIEMIESSKGDPIILPEINLELSGNKIKNLELLKVEIFEIKLNNHSLESLNVNASYIFADNNKLTSIRVKGKTRTLSLRNNLISVITFDDHLSMLRSIYLSGNNLSSDAVYDLTRKIINTEVFDISNNFLGNMKVDMFSEMTRLDKLSLSGVGMTELTYGLFSHQKVLRTLDISYNILNDIDFHIFSSLSTVENLDVSGTNIGYLNHCRRLKDILPRLRSIGLENNNWTCKILSRTLGCLNTVQVTIMEPVNPVKNETSVSGIKCTQIAVNETKPVTTATGNPPAASTSKPNNDRINEIMKKMNFLSEKMNFSNGSSAISTLELVLSILLAVATTLLTVYGIVKVKNFYKRNRFRMPRISGGRNSPDTVITYDSSLGR